LRRRRDEEDVPDALIGDELEDIIREFVIDIYRNSGVCRFGSCSQDVCAKKQN